MASSSRLVEMAAQAEEESDDEGKDDGVNEEETEKNDVADLQESVPNAFETDNNAGDLEDIQEDEEEDDNDDDVSGADYRPNEHLTRNTNVNQDIVATPELQQQAPVPQQAEVSPVIESPRPDPVEEARKAKEEELRRKAEEANMAKEEELRRKAEEANRAKEEELRRKNEERQMGIQERQLKLQQELMNQLHKAEEEAINEQRQLEKLMQEDELYEEVVRDLQRLKKANVRLESIRKDDRVDKLKEEILNLHNQFHEIDLEHSSQEFDVKDLKKDIFQLQKENQVLIERANSFKLEELKNQLNSLQKANSQLHETILKDKASQLKLQKALTNKYLIKMQELKANKAEKDWEIAREGPSYEVAEMDRRYYTEDLKDLYLDYKQMYSRIRGPKELQKEPFFVAEKEKISNSEKVKSSTQVVAEVENPYRDKLLRRSKPSFSANSGEKLMTCHNFQVGRCKENKDHIVYVKGKPRFYRHICEKCYTYAGEISRHPFVAEECPVSAYTSGRGSRISEKSRSGYSYSKKSL